LTISKILGKYWLLQTLVIGIIGIYSFGIGLGFVFLITTPSTHSDRVSILMIIESNHPSYSFNFSYFDEVPINRTLLDHLNITIGRENWDGRYFGVGGWYIERIFNASEIANWHWLIYHRVPGLKKWALSAGVSSFLLNQDYEIKFVFDVI